MNYLIRTENLFKVYKMGETELKALDGVSCEIEKGEFAAVMGHSGSGKSTFMNVLGFLDEADSGEYFFEDGNVRKLDEDTRADYRLKKIGFIFQSFNLLPRLTALKNVELPMIYSGIKKKEREKIAAERLNSIGMGSRLHHKPSELSGGQQQRVAIARALVNDPQVILADEPTGNLDSASSNEIMGILTALNKEGKTIIMVTHEPDIAKFAHRVIHFKDGKIMS